MNPPARRLFDRYDALAGVLLLVLVPAISVPVLNHLVRGTATVTPRTDYPAHNAFAVEMRQAQRVTVPHPLYHVVLLTVKRTGEQLFGGHRPRINARNAIRDAGEDMQGPLLAALNAAYANASVVTLVLFLLMLAAVLWRQVRAAAAVQTVAGTVGAIVLILCLMLAAPIALLCRFDNDYYLGYIGINVWHSPTVIAAKPFVLLSLIVVAAAFPSDAAVPERRSVRAIINTALIIALGALAKPSFLICLIPAAAILAAWRAAHRLPVRWSLLALGLVLPAVPLLLWQSHVYGAITHGSHAVFAPLSTMSSMSEHLAAKFALSIVFPLVCYIAWWPLARRSTRLQLAALAFVVGVFFTYFISETRRAAHGNFLWSAQFALFVLFVECALLVLQGLRDRAPRARPRAIVCAAALAPHVVFGLLYYAHLLSIPSTEVLSFR